MSKTATTTRTTSNTSNTTIRIYFADATLLSHSALQDTFHLIEKTSLTRLYSNEGIFNIKDNKITRVKIQDQPVEPLTINTIDFLIDRSSITDDAEWYQLSPQHIIEKITLYTYASANTNADANADTDTLPLKANSVTLIMEKQDEHIRAVYFQITENNFSKDDLKNILVTFLSTLNLC
jgi:hypothetical protein